MSRIGKKPIIIPEGVEVRVEGQTVVVKGPKGELSREVRPEIKIEIKEKNIILSLRVKTKSARAFWGTERAQLANMIIGLNKGFEKKLEIRGVGYKARIEEENLILEVGFSHPVIVQPIRDANFSVVGNIITISGISKEKVGQLTAKIRKVKPPDPYKGKGIRYLGEEVKLKPGKKAVTAT